MFSRQLTTQLKHTNANSWSSACADVTLGMRFEQLGSVIISNLFDTNYAPSNRVLEEHNM